MMAKNKRYFLTTCGLSFFTNGLKDTFDSSEIYKRSNKKINEIDKDFLLKFEPAYKRLLNACLTSGDAELKKLSAELNALMTFYNGDFQKSDYHDILFTGTFLGEKAADLLKNVLANKGLVVQKFSMPDLNVSNIEDFHMSLGDVVKKLSVELIDYKNNNYQIIFNLTGGFKAINSFLQTMGSIYADKIIYIFEKSEELLTIPKLPIKIDESVIVDNFDIFRKLEMGKETDPVELDAIPETLSIKVDTSYTLSPWGEVIWQKVKNENYRKKLYDPIVKNIVYSENFRKKAEDLQSNRLLELNKKIEDLTNYLDSGKDLSSLNFKKLVGSPKSRSTHEFYINSDEAMRCYCHYEGGVLVLDEYGNHL